MSLTELAQTQDQIGEGAPAWHVHIGGKRMSKRQITQVSFAQNDQGVAKLDVEGELDPRSLDNAPVSLRAGYGAQTPLYFSGHLVDPKFDAPEAYGSATAFDPFGMMGRQHLLRDLQFVNQTAETGVYEVISGSLLNTRRLEVLGARKYRFTEDFFEEFTIEEALDGILDPIEYVRASRPGYGGLIMPPPGPGSTSRRKAVYKPKHYPPGGFNPVKESAFYSEVRVLRRNEDGVYEVRAKEAVENEVTSDYPPNRNRAYYILDYTGTQAEADLLAYETSVRLREGTWKWSLENIAFNPDLLFFDTIEVRRTFEGLDGVDYEEAFSCQIDAGITAEISREDFDMSLSGRAVRLYSRPMARVTPVIDGRLSQGVMPI